MALTTGTRLGPYEVIAAIGEGGMGEVYRARDTTLNRDVAIKVLPAAMASDPERLARFKREAQVLASLSHSNIAHVYGFEGAALPEGSTVHFLAMEMVEGEDLSERLKRGAIPLDEGITIAKQIAEGLEDAHEHGIIHRDLKPANIKITPGGKVKVLDFGLARALEGDASSATANSQMSHSPTMSRRMTEAGMILGTAAYMSPEQARGKPVDKRTDIWAFGVVLYEILTGRRAFEGGDVTEVLAAVIRDTPDMNALPAGTPEPIRRLLRRCLEKDRHERLPDIGAARLEIKDALAGAPESTARTAAPRPREPRLFGLAPIPAALGLVAAVLAIALAVSLMTRPNPPGAAAGVIRFPLISDPKIRVTTGITQPFAISPDGTTIVFSGRGPGGTNLWARTLDEPAPRRIAETEGGAQPAISPDGEWVAFVTANHVIRKVRIKGGGATTIASINDTTAAIAWGLHDDIVFELIGSASGIQRVSANGGTPELLIPMDAEGNEARQRRPFVLRDERRVLYASLDKTGSATLSVFSPDDGRRAHLRIEGIQALGLIDRELIYTRADGALMAVPFDARGMQVTGSPRQLADRVASSGVGTPVTMSPRGTLVYQPSGAQAYRLMLGDPSGLLTPLGSWVRAFGEARFSPDGQRVAAGISGGEEGEGLWIIDRASAEATRMGGAEDAGLVDWTPDGKALVTLRSGRAEAGSEIWSTPVDGSRPATRLIHLEGSVREAALSRDGRSIVVARRLGASTTQELVSVSLESGQVVTTIVPSISSGGSLRPGGPRVSRDGKWVAFVDEGAYQLHVRSLSGTGGVQISDNGAEYAVWGVGDGQIFYGMWNGLVEASLQTAPLLTVRKRQRLEAWESQMGLFDISSDGKAFLSAQPTTEGSQALVALNWGASLAPPREK